LLLVLVVVGVLQVVLAAPVTKVVGVVPEQLHTQNLFQYLLVLLTQ
jgi:hypothetical protein